MSVAPQIREFYSLIGQMKKSGYRVVVTQSPRFESNRLKAELTIENNQRVWTYDFRLKEWGTYPATSKQEE